MNDTTSRHKAYFQMNFNHSVYFTSEIDSEVSSNTLVGATNITSEYRLVKIKLINEYNDVSCCV